MDHPAAGEKQKSPVTRGFLLSMLIWYLPAEPHTAAFPVIKGVGLIKMNYRGQTPFCVLVSLLKLLFVGNPAQLVKYLHFPWSDCHYKTAAKAFIQWKPI